MTEFTDMDAFARAHGFTDATELTQTTARVDLVAPGALMVFKDWQDYDGTKAGLLWRFPYLAGASSVGGGSMMGEPKESGPVSGGERAAGLTGICAHRFDSTVCVASAGHEGPHVTSNERFPHGLAIGGVAVLPSGEGACAECGHDATWHNGAEDRCPQCDGQIRRVTEPSAIRGFVERSTMSAEETRCPQSDNDLRFRIARVPPPAGPTAAMNTLEDIVVSALESHDICDNEHGRSPEEIGHLLTWDLWRAGVRLAAAPPELCSVCAGTGKPLSGKPCICKGVGTMYAELQGFRERCYDLEREASRAAAPRTVEQLAKLLQEAIESPELNFPNFTYENTARWLLPRLAGGEEKAQ